MLLQPVVVEREISELKQESKESFEMLASQIKSLEESLISDDEFIMVSIFEF